MNVFGKMPFGKMLAIAHKDTRLRFSSAAEWLYFLILPLVFTLILSGGTGGPQDSRLRVVVVDQAQTPLSAELLALLDDSQALRAELLPIDQAAEEFRSGNAVAQLIIPANFELAALSAGEAAVELRAQPNDTNALAAEQAVAAVVRRLNSETAIAALSAEAAGEISPFPSDAARLEYFDRARLAARSELSAAPERLSTSLASTQDEIEYDPRANSSAGQLITWVFIPLLGISGMFAYERQTGALRRLLTTPTRTGVFFLGTIGGQVALAMLQMLILVGFGALALGVNWGSSPAALAAVLLATAISGAALGSALGAFVKSENQAGGLSVMLGMVMALLGGCWYPLELFSEAVRTATLVLPTRWAMQGMLDILLRGQGLSGVLPEVAALLGFAVLFFAVGVARFRFE